jgi:P-type Ca2+ transporter type 2C
VYLLLAAVAALIAAWALEGASGAPFESIVIDSIVVANGVLGFVQERRAQEAVAALQRMVATSVAVVRDGTEVRVPADSVVPGDIVVLREGDVVDACLRRR